jgi:flagellar protein FliS
MTRAGSAFHPIEAHRPAPMVSAEASSTLALAASLDAARTADGRDITMMRASGYDAYQRVQAETSTPGQLIALLYDAMVRSLDRAKAGLDQHDLESAHAPILRAQDIVLELISSLNMDDDGEAGAMARQLGALYEYMYRRLLDASLHKDGNAIDEVRRLIVPVREAWANALEQLSRQAASAPVAPGMGGRRG